MKTKLFLIKNSGRVRDKIEVKCQKNKLTTGDVAIVQEDADFPM